MKKFGLVLSLVLVFAMTLSMAVSAGPNGIVENPPIAVPKVSPTVDGNIDAAEGWSSPAYMNTNTLGYYWSTNPLTMDGTVYFAYDSEGLYFSANIVEGLSAIDMNGDDVEGLNQFNYSTGSDNLDNGKYAFNGDVFGLSVDPLGAMLNASFTGNEDYAPIYFVSLFEGNVAKMARGKVNEGEITEDVKVAGHTTDNGWTFEAFIPWDIILADVSAITFDEVNVTKDELLESGSLVRAAALYQDRFYDEEQGDVATWGRYITVLKELPTGTPGEKSSGDDVKSMGLTLFLDNTDKYTGTTGADPTKPTEPPVTTAPGEQGGENGGNNNGGAANNGGNGAANNNGGNNGGGASTTKAANKGAAKGGSSAQTFDIGIAVALGALATSGIGFYATKKRK